MRCPTSAEGATLSAETAAGASGFRGSATAITSEREQFTWEFRDPQREPVRSRFAALLARAAEVDRFALVRPLMRGYADEIGRLYAQLVLGRPALAAVG